MFATVWFLPCCYEAELMCMLRTDSGKSKCKQNLAADK